MAYPIESLSPASTAQDQQSAIEQTIQQLMAEGMTQEQAQQQAMGMLQAIQNPTNGMPGKQSTNFGNSMANPNASFVRGGGSGQPSGPTANYSSVLNPRFNNFNPLPGPSGYSNK